MKTDLAGAENYVLQEAISALADEAYTNAKKLTGTGIVGANDQINRNTETFVGQIRWRKPLNPTINVASLTNPADGSKTSSAQEYLRYIKTVRTHGAEKVNMQAVVTQEDGLAKVANDIVETRSQDEHNAMLAVLKGIALTEALYGAAAASGSAGLGGQTFENDTTNKRYGFYVDLADAKPVVAPSANIQGAARAEGFLQALGKAYKDYEPEYCYLISSPETIASLRSANLVDKDSVTEGNVTFNTIFQGKFRLIQTRASQGFTSAELAKINTGAGVDIVGTKTSFIVLPSALAYEMLDVPDAVEIGRKAAAYNGGGSTELWYRWGYVLAPAGYDWIGAEDAFPTDASYRFAKEGADPKDFLTVASGTLASTTGTWNRKFTSALSLGILPVFHS